jgi:hypothetical protein
VKITTRSPADHNWFVVTAGHWYCTSIGLLPATGPPAVRQRRGRVGGGVSAERIPRGKPPNLAQMGEIVLALSCEPLPNHVLPLAHFVATSDVYDSGVMVRTAGHHNAGGERSGSTQHYDLEVHRASVGGW